jgi:hypothetical protein
MAYYWSGGIIGSNLVEKLISLNQRVVGLATSFS